MPCRPAPLRILPLALALAGLAAPARGAWLELERQATQYHLHVNGVAWHLQRRGLNEQNWGLGFAALNRRTRSPYAWLDGWTIAEEVETFLGSHRNWGASVGLSARRALGSHLYFGLNSGLIYQRAYQDDFGTPVIPFVLPFLETRFRGGVNLRMTYCPPVNRSFHVLMFQCVIPLGRR